MPGPLASGTQGSPASPLWPVLGISLCPPCERARRGFARQMEPCKLGGRRSSGEAYLGPWRSREPWLAWRPVIPLRREWWRLQPQTWTHWLAHTGNTPLSSPAQLSTPVTNTGHTGTGSFSLPSSPLWGRGGVRSTSVPCAHQPRASPEWPQQVCAEEVGGQVKGREFVLQSAIIG